jgi:hypothetical protein
MKIKRKNWGGRLKTPQPFVAENGAHLVQPEHEILNESVDELWQHGEKVHVNCGQCEWDKIGHQIADGSYGICPSVFLECPNWLESHDLAFLSH